MSEQHLYLSVSNYVDLALTFAVFNIIQAVCFLLSVWHHGGFILKVNLNCLSSEEEDEDVLLL